MTDNRLDQCHAPSSGDYRSAPCVLQRQRLRKWRAKHVHSLGSITSHPARRSILCGDHSIQHYGPLQHLRYFEWTLALNAPHEPFAQFTTQALLHTKIDPPPCSPSRVRPQLLCRGSGSIIPTTIRRAPVAHLSHRPLHQTLVT